MKNAAKVLSSTETLPPLDVRLVDPYEKIATPLDERGLVDIQGLIRVVKTTVDPDYVWPTTDTDTHHFYWPRKWYGSANHRSGLDGVQKQFQDLPVNQGELPIVFHRWLHHVTLPPIQPAVEVMRYRVEAWRVARNLFYSLVHQTKWQRTLERQHKQATTASAKDMACIDEDVILEILSTNFEHIDKSLSEMARIPAEFRVIDPGMPLKRIAKEVGRLAIPRAHTLTRSVGLAA